jgi:hypothetical protein
MRTTFRTVLLAGVMVALAVAAPPAGAADPLAVGATAPPLEMTDQNGVMRDLATLAPNRGVVLLFTRSLHW